MRAAVRDVYGESDVVQVREIDVPRPGAGKVLVKVDAAGVDRGMWHLMAGLPLASRLAFGLRRPREPRLGQDIAGTVVAVGTGVSEYAVGDPVSGAASGGLAEYVVASPKNLAPWPRGLTAAEAAVLPTSGLTALQALRDKARVQPGQSVLVIGASGGVGTYAVQLAQDYGAIVTAVCSAAKDDVVRSLGVDDIIHHETDTIGGRRWDVILDIGGNRPLGELRAALAPAGTLIFIGGEGAGRILGMGRQARAALLTPFVRQRLITFLSLVRSEDLVALGDAVQRGALAPVIERSFTLDDAAAAIDHVGAGRARGKVVVTI